MTGWFLVVLIGLSFLMLVAPVLFQQYLMETIDE